MDTTTNENTLAGEIEYLSCRDKFNQIFVDDSSNDVNICIWLREFKEVLAVLEFQPVLTKPERVYIDVLVDKASCMPFLVALEDDQQAILRASVALEQIRRDNLNGKLGQYLPHVEVARLKFLACYFLCGEVFSKKPHNYLAYSDGDLILERVRWIQIFRTPAKPSS